MSDVEYPRQYNTIQQLIAVHAKISPNGAAICAPGHVPLTYRQLQLLIAQNLCAFNSLGIGRGDRVAIVLPNGPEMATAFLSVAAGATSAPLNPNYSASEFDFYLSDLNAKALLILKEMDSPSREIAQKLDIPIIDLTPVDNQAAGIFKLDIDPGNQQQPEYSTPEDEALVLHTSGTTSRPKIVPLSQENICASAHNISTTLALSRTDKCLNVMPLFHIHGLMAPIMGSIAAGASVICTYGFKPDEFFAWFTSFQPTWYSAVPTIHMSILDAAKVHTAGLEETQLRFIRSSSASLPPQVMDQLEQCFNVPVIEAYGMTEAAHQMASNPLPPGTRKPGSVGPAAGPDIAIMNESGQLLNTSEIGEIVISGANITHGYENNPEANSTAFCHGWFRTGDQGHMDEEGYLYITGRLKEIINRGGEKVSPREIDEALLDHPQVSQAIAFAVPHDSLGEDIAAAVVLKPNANISANDLRQGLFGRLADFKIPTQIFFIDAIPKGPTGKIQRIGLAEKLAPAMSQRFVAPANDLEFLLAGIYEDVLGIEKVGRHDNFFSLGGNSLQGTQVISRIQSAFRVDLPITALFRKPTISELGEEISQGGKQEDLAMIAEILAEIDNLSDEEARHLLDSVSDNDSM